MFRTDWLSLQLTGLRQQIAEMFKPTATGRPQLLNEIAVIPLALPVNAHELAAHHSVKIAGIVGLLQ